jgi:flavin-binding protein dodecin
LEVRIKVGRKQAQAALDEEKKTIKDITGLEVNDITASVDPNTNTIKEYKVGVKNAFGLNTRLNYNLHVVSE